METEGEAQKRIDEPVEHEHSAEDASQAQALDGMPTRCRGKPGEEDGLDDETRPEKCRGWVYRAKKEPVVDDKRTSVRTRVSPEVRRCIEPCRGALPFIAAPVARG